MYRPLAKGGILKQNNFTRMDRDKKISQREKPKVIYITKGKNLLTLKKKNVTTNIV